VPELIGDEMKDERSLRKARNSKAAALLIHGGRVIDPSRGMDEVGDLLVAKGKIVQVGNTIALGSLPLDMLSQAKSIDAMGLIVCPGFIDLHCHLRDSRIRKLLPRERRLLLRVDLPLYAVCRTRTRPWIHGIPWSG